MACEKVFTVLGWMTKGNYCSVQKWNARAQTSPLKIAAWIKYRLSKRSPKALTDSLDESILFIYFKFKMGWYGPSQESGQNFQILNLIKFQIWREQTKKMANLPS